MSEFGSSLRVRSSLKLVIESNFKVYALGPLEENKLSLQIMAQFMEVRVGGMVVMKRRRNCPIWWRF